MQPRSWRFACIVLILPLAFAEGADRSAEIAELLASRRASGEDPIGRGGSGCSIQHIACGQTLFRDISASDCITESGILTDFYDFGGIAGQTITATMSSNDFDPFLFLFDPDIEVAATDDNSGPGDAAQIVFLINRTSPDWTLAATPLEPFVVGDYTLSLTCAGSTPSPPAAPSNLVATAASATSIGLSWQDNSNGENNFRIERRTGSASFVEIASVTANTTQFIDNGRTPSTTYDYRVRARNGGGDSLYSNVATATTPGTAPTGPCVADSHTLCLLDDRFQVEVDFAPPGEALRPATAVPFTDRAGMFLFFNEANIEMLVKLQNACVAPFDRFWVFYAATTNVQLSVRVTDTERGIQQVYTNPQGTAALPVQDTQSFATCP